MKKFIVIIFALLFSFQMISFAQKRSPSPATHFYIVEYIRGEKISCHTLDITFFIKTSPQQAEEILRNQLSFIVKNFPPKIDILATAWYSTSSNLYESSMVPLPNGKNHLAYSAKTRKTDYLAP